MSCSLMATLSFSYQWLEETRERKNFSHTLSHCPKQSVRGGNFQNHLWEEEESCTSCLQRCWIHNHEVSPSPDDVLELLFLCSKGPHSPLFHIPWSCSSSGALGIIQVPITTGSISPIRNTLSYPFLLMLFITSNLNCTLQVVCIVAI